MNLSLSCEMARDYHSQSQKIRVISESWVKNQIYCPSCGLEIKEYSSNKPVADFFCLNCKEDYELKSKQGCIPSKIVDGAYKTMLERLESENNPNLFFIKLQLKNNLCRGFLGCAKAFFCSSNHSEKKASFHQGATSWLDWMQYSFGWSS